MEATNNNIEKVFVKNPNTGEITDITSLLKLADNRYCTFEERAKQLERAIWFCVTQSGESADIDMLRNVVNPLYELRDAFNSVKEE